MPRTPKRSLRSIGVGAAILVVTVTAGCGGDDALSEEEFVAEANAICVAGNERIGTAADEILQGGPPTGASGREFFDVIVIETHTMIDQVGDLEPPQDLEAPVDALLADARDVADRLEAGGPSALFGAASDPYADVNAQFTAIGVSACAEDGE